jgi:predicted metal-dependent hydrolase
MTHAVDKTGDWKDRLYKLGFELFNRGDRFEAHEEWEAIWLDEPKGHPNRLFLQGLIQVAAAFHRVDTDFKKAAFRLFRSSRRKLIPFAPSYKGVNIADVIPRLEKWRDRLAAQIAGKPAAEVPYFAMRLEGRGWHAPTREGGRTPEELATFKAFEQYSSDREVRAECPKCGTTLAVNGRRRAPADDAEAAWKVACPKSCVSHAYAAGAAL